MPRVDSFQPGNVLKIAFPSFSPIPTGIESSSSNTSNFVIFQQTKPFTSAEYFKSGMCSHPQRRGRLVTEPYSPPLSRKRSPVSPVTSVGNVPEPTRVQYAFATPMQEWSERGGNPSPCSAPAAVVKLLVT